MMLTQHQFHIRSMLVFVWMQIAQLWDANGSIIILIFPTWDVDTLQAPEGPGK